MTNPPTDHQKADLVYLQEITTARNILRQDIARQAEYLAQAERIVAQKQKNCQPLREAEQLRDEIRAKVINLEAEMASLNREIETTRQRLRSQVAANQEILAKSAGLLRQFKELGIDTTFDALEKEQKLSSVADELAALKAKLKIS
jgi:ferric-dicitrate binding protein FerR (iron transport regulator)